MYLELIIILVLLSYLRKTVQRDGSDPVLLQRINIATAVSIALIAVGGFLHGKHGLGAWITHAFALLVLYVGFKEPRFKQARSLFYAVLPILFIGITDDFVELVAPAFHDDYNNFFQTASVFGFVWLFAMWFIVQRQRKALDNERKKALEKEKDLQLTEKIKAELEIQVADRTAALTQQKKELENTITELKSTQAQLIQAEKMASLGELTAGIAHEIQNPLNFVNNFSELNAELITEMLGELQKGNAEEAKAIAADIAENEKKINHHGKRADAIVKGMLQHSRNSTGQKEPTDINALADEYLRLAYHGLRAKDKTFNAQMKTEFDSNLGKVSVVPQDMGRVLLNLITNAFFAVNQKKTEMAKQPGSTYEPAVTVVTRRYGNKIEITVKDNGNGIPPAVLDKIYQPFFTTKPTGQGTGLGLSMSYDIVTKMHGGEIKVDNRVNEGAAFIITLPA
jgi:C4-dicarboxylate-specific signal transduction histidine kinase